MTSSVLVLVAQQAALGLGFVGVVAGFWHIMTIAGIAILVSAILGVAVHSAGYVQVEEEDAQATPGAEQPPDYESAELYGRPEEGRSGTPDPAG